MVNLIDYNIKDISDKTVKRLTKYLRVLNDFKKKKNNVNSVELATKMNSTSSQVRKDLSTFGEFGVRSKGYDIKHLIDVIEHILGIDEDNKIILVGHGNMGKIITSNIDVLGKGFLLVAVFEKDKTKIGKKIEKLDLHIEDIEHLQKIIEKENVKECILAVNKEKAQETAELLIELGITGILNLTSKKLSIPENIAATEVDFSIKLQEMNFWRKHKSLEYENN